MRKCLDENELAQYCEYLLDNSKMPIDPVLTHIAKCLQCKMTILEVCEILIKVDSVILPEDLSS